MRWGLIVSLVVALTSCSSSQVDRRTSVLWTDTPALAPPVERYNASQSEWQILLVYHADLASALLSPGDKPDLVVSTHLEPAAIKGTLASLDFLFDRGQATRSQFYRGLLEAGTLGTDLRLLPLSFDLPILAFSRKRLPDLDPSTIRPDQIQELSASFDRKNGLQMAFSPLWGEFPLTYLQLAGVGFNETFQGGLGWSAEALSKSLEDLSSWTAQNSQTWTSQHEFTLKYLTTSPFPLLRDGRILFYPTHLSEFLSLPLDERRDLDYRFLEVDNFVAASDDVLWAAIPASALHQGAAQNFLADLLAPSTQTSLVNDAFLTDFRPFGFLGSLSSQTATNTSVLPVHYPDLAHHLPPPNRIKFWPALPVNWPTLRDRVIRPWLATGPTNAHAPDLRASVDNWGKPQQ